MSEDIKRTPTEWLGTSEFSTTVVLDNDGWRGEGAPAWETPLTYAEFVELLGACTIGISAEKLRSISDS